MTIHNLYMYAGNDENLCENYVYTTIGSAYSIIPNYFYPAAYKLSTCFDHHSILYRIWIVNLSGLPLSLVVMRSIRSTVERRFESYSGNLFSAMKTEHVVVAEQVPPLGPAYSIIPTYISFIMGLHMLLLLHALIPCLAAYIWALLLVVLSKDL